MSECVCFPRTRRSTGSKRFEVSVSVMYSVHIFICMRCGSRTPSMVFIATIAQTQTLIQLAPTSAAGLKIQWMQLLFSLNGKHSNRN